MLGDVKKVFVFKKCVYNTQHTSSELFPKFEFSLKVKVMGSNPGYLLKSFLLYSQKIASKFLDKKKVNSGHCIEAHLAAGSSFPLEIVKVVRRQMSPRVCLDICQFSIHVLHNVYYAMH